MPSQRKLISVLALSLSLGACALTPREGFTAADQAEIGRAHV